MLFWLHPLWQAAATLLALHVLYLGWQRARATLLRQKASFAWQAHVRRGRWAIALWLAGAGIGIAVAAREWQAFFITGSHADVGLVFIALAVVQYLLGHCMATWKKNRKVLPVIHGLLGICLILLVFRQAWTGWEWLAS